MGPKKRRVFTEKQETAPVGHVESIRRSVHRPPRLISVVAWHERSMEGGMRRLLSPAHSPSVDAAMQGVVSRPTSQVEVSAEG